MNVVCANPFAHLFHVLVLNKPLGYSEHLVPQLSAVNYLITVSSFFLVLLLVEIEINE